MSNFGYDSAYENLCLLAEYDYQQIELLWVREILRRYKGNRTHAIAVLGISNRSMHRYLKLMDLYKIDIPDYDQTSRKLPAKRLKR